MRKNINSLADLNEVSLELSKKLKPGNICLLYADMGMGKTTLVSHIMAHLGFTDVSSPTYSIIQHYESNPPVCHIDLYRLESQTQIDLLDLDYYLNQDDHIVFIEWAERLQDFHWPAFKIKLFKDEDSNRVIECDF